MSTSDLVRAQMSDGPWGPLLGALAARGFTGEVTVDAAGKRHVIELRRGQITDASSPLAGDAIMRVALTSHLITPVHIATISRALEVAAGRRDEVDVVAETARLSPAQAHTLRQRAIAQRAARTFALERGEVTIAPAALAAPKPGAIEIDVGAVIFAGARLHMTDVRLASELRRLGGRFVLALDADQMLPRFGFGADGVAVANMIRGAGATLAELDAMQRDIDPRAASAAIYALVSCGAATGAASATIAAPPAQVVAVARTMSESFESAPTKHVVPARGSSPSLVQRMRNEVIAPRTRSDLNTPRALPVVPRTATDLAVPSADLSVPRTMSPTRPAVPRTMTPRWTASSIAELEQVVAQRLALVDQGADYFSVLGLGIDASVEAVRAAHRQLARALEPQALAEHASPALKAAAERLSGHVAAALAVLADPARRAAYTAALQRSGDPLVGMPRTRTIEEERARSPAEEAIHRGLLMMRADQPERAAAEIAKAVELEPGNIDHTVLLAWARFCAATDKGAAATAVRKMLMAASRQSDKPQVALFYLGRVERMLGRDKEALEYFHEALDRDPANLEAAAEVRVLESRMAATQKTKR
jgi:curved DNA-binding protein CbpA